MPELDELPDDALLARMATGDREAFAALYRRRRRDVYRFALHVGGSSSLAQDVTQEVFLALIHDAGKYQPGRAGALAWLLGIARNHVRRGLARDRRLEPLETGESSAGVTPDGPLADLLRREHLAALHQALLDLPVRFREAVVLCDLHELSYEDAAAAIGCAVGTLRSRLHRGRRRIADRLGGDSQAAPLRMAARIL